MDRKRQNRLLLLMVLFASVPLFLVNHLPFQDTPDWTLQATILNNLDDARFTEHYALKWLPVPNLTGTLLIAGIGRLSGEIFAAKVVAFLCVALFVTGFVYLRRADGRLAPHIEILGVLFAVNHFLMMGYFNFVLGLALSFFAVGYYWRRAPFFAKESSLVLALLITLIYFTHGLAFFVASAAVVLIAWRTHLWQLKKYAAPFFSLMPGLVLTGAYTLIRNDDCVIGYVIRPLVMIWNRIVPFMPLSNFDPVSPPLIAWVVLTVNLIAILLLATLVVWIIYKKAIDYRSPMIMLAIVLFVLGMIAPMGLCGLIRPGQRLMFAALFFFLAGVDAPRDLRKELRTTTVLAMLCILIISGANIFFAGKHLNNAVKIIEKHLPPNSSFCMINDTNFDMEKKPAMMEKITDPLSYSPWVSPLKAAGYYHLRNHGGFLGQIFPYGLLKAEGKSQPSVNHIGQLSDPEWMKPYSYVIISGRPKNVQSLVEAADHSFSPVRHDVYFALLKRRPPVKPMDVGPLYYIWMPGP